MQGDEQFLEISSAELKMWKIYLGSVTTILATLGYSPDKVTQSIKEESGVDAVVAFYGSRQNPSTRRAVGRLQDACAVLGLSFQEREIGSAYDFVSAVLAYRAEIARRRGEALIFNIGSGTSVMQAAATFVCFTEGLPMVYYNVEERRYARMPTVALAPASRVSPQQERILKLLLLEPLGLRPGEVARKARLSPSNVDYHLRRLSDGGLVEFMADPQSRRQRARATSVARLIYA